MKINIYLLFYKDIAGGYKVVYQYSNYLAEKGYDVTIYYDLLEGKNSHHIPKQIMIFLKKLFQLKYPYYFKLNKKVKQVSIKTICDKFVNDADISIATSPQTAIKVANLSAQKGKKIYFIQGYENWHISDEELHKTYNLDMQNIVISKWLKDIVDKYSKSSSTIVHNGIDLTKFRLKNNIKNRNKYTIAMIYHTAENKGCKYGIEALIKLKKMYPQLNVNMYGAPKKTKKLPNWFNYTQGANEEQVVDILNQSSIFLCTSLFEGFGLPGLEAMACGCALVTTDCHGPREYATNDNSIYCQKANTESICNAISKLLKDDNLKEKNIQKGLETVKKWDINISRNKFEKAIKDKG